MRRSTALVAAIAVLFIAFVFYSLARVEPLKVQGERLERVGDRVMVRGTVSNTGPDLPQAGLQVRLFDARGHQLVRQTVTLGRLNTGQSRPFSSPPYAAQDVEKFTVQVDRENNMYGN
jgi:hypothetical protein